MDDASTQTAGGAGNLAPPLRVALPPAYPPAHGSEGAPPAFALLGPSTGGWVGGYGWSV